MIVLCILVFIYFIFNITFIVNVFMWSIEKKNVPNSVSSIIANKIVKWYLLTTAVKT